jgi:trimeric autotransporter adhesin
MTTIAGNRTFSGYNGDNIPASTARLNGPRGIAFDASGNLFIADAGNNNIRVVNAVTRRIQSYAGGSKCSTRAICLSCTCNSTTYTKAYAGFTGDGSVATSAWLNGPYSMALDVSGNLFIADTGNSRIRMVAATTMIITTVAGAGAYQYSATTTTLCPYYPKSAPGVNWCPAQAAPTGSSGTTYQATYSGMCCDGYPATSAWLKNPSAVVVDSSGNLFIADGGNNRLRKVALSAGGNISSVDTLVSGPQGLFIDTSNNVYTADTANNRIKVYNATTGVKSALIGNAVAAYYGDGGPVTLAELKQPYALTIDASGNIYIADQGNYRIRKVAGEKIQNYTWRIILTSLTNILHYPLCVSIL